MWLLLGSRGPGRGPPGKAAALVQVSAGRGAASEGQWHQGTGGMENVGAWNRCAWLWTCGVRKGEDGGWLLGSWAGQLGGQSHCVEAQEEECWECRKSSRHPWVPCSGHR